MKGYGNSVLLNEDFLKPKSLFWISKVYLLVGSVLHINCIVIHLVCGFEELAWVSLAYIVEFMTCFFIFKVKRIRWIYTLITCSIGAYIIAHVILFGWKYNFNMYSFMMVPLCILTCIAPGEKEYNIKYPIVLFLLTQGSLLLFRIYMIMSKMEPIIVLDKETANIYNIEGIIIYAISTMASFVPIFGFLLDLNEAYKRIEVHSYRLKYKATHDPLTQLINRRSINEKLDEAYADYYDNKEVFSIIMVDIDDFKKINDIYGHNAGDIVLKDISNIIIETVGENDHVCRWGGEEILILTYGNIENAISIAENIRKNVSEYVFVSDDEIIKATVTLGVAQMKEKLDMDKLISLADNNLYKGKRGTKNCVVA